MAFVGLLGVTMALAVYAGIAAVFFYILYRVIKAAVKKGIIEAHEEMKK